MRFLAILKPILLVTTLFFQFNSFSFNNENSKEFSGGTISVEGSNMTTTSDDIDDAILHVYVINSSGVIHEYGGCEEYSCSFSSIHLSSGVYDVIVISTSGGFEGEAYFK